MNLYYAMGGGLGHLTRAKAFLHQFGLEKSTSILTHHISANDKRVVGNIDVIEVSKESTLTTEQYKNFLNKLFVSLLVETVYLDTFPFGIKGEFSNFDFGDAKVNYIARLMNWVKYLKINPIEKIIQFDKCFVLEDLENDHKDFIFQNSNTVNKLKIEYPKPDLTPDNQAKYEEIINKKKFWLVVHSFGKDEITDLIYIADEQRKIEKRAIEIVVITPMNFESEVENCSIYNIYPVSVLFPFASRIFTACGFNIMEQTSEFRHKHHFVPVERTYDKQYLRAERIRKSLLLNS